MYDKAYYYFEKAARVGNRDAMYYLSEMYMNGEGVEFNPTKALAWKQKSGYTD